MSSEILKLHIHYDVEKHFISMSDFLIASNAAQKIIDDLNRQILRNHLKYELVIIPPEEGTFLKTVGIVIATVAIHAAIVPIASDYVLGAFKGITEHEPSEYGENHGRALRDLAVGFFSKEVEDLEKCIPRELNLDRAFKAKAEFYASCQNNNHIHGLGFDDTKNFPIRSNSFKNHISKDRTRPLNSDFIIYDVIVTSPVTEDKDYVWDFEDIVTSKKISAYMRDEAFKKGVLNGDYPFKNDGSKSDRLKILVEHKKQERNGEVEKKETCVVSVYYFNDREIKKIPANLPQGARFQQKEETPMDKIWFSR